MAGSAGLTTDQMQDWAASAGGHDRYAASMLDRIQGHGRIDAAKAVLADLATEHMPAGAPVAIRSFRHRADPCATRLAVPLSPLDAAAVTALIERIGVDREADTPVGAALTRVASDRGVAGGTRSCC